MCWYGGWRPQNSLHYWFLQQNDSLVSRREADLVWRCLFGGDGKEMVVRLFCGCGARILPWMIIFTNRQIKHTIREIPESSPAFWEKSGLEGWLIERIFRWLTCRCRQHRLIRLVRMIREYPWVLFRERFCRYIIRIFIYLKILHIWLVAEYWFGKKIQLIVCGYGVWSF